MSAGYDPLDARLNHILSKFEKVKKVRGGYIARCPSHQDDTPSLSVSLGEKGVVLYDWGGCPTINVLRAAGLTWGDLFYQSTQVEQGGTKPKRADMDRRGLELEALMACSRLEGETEVLQTARARRGWAAGALKVLGVGWDGERFTLPIKDAENRMHDVLRYNPYVDRFKMLAGEGRSRQPWPRPEDVSTVYRSRGLYVVEGEGTAISLASVGLPVVALPGAVARASGDVRNPSRFEGVGWHRAWAKRFRSHGRLYLFPDADETGRTLMMTAHFDLTKEGLFPIVCETGGPKGFDLGDLLRPAQDLELRRQAKSLITTFADTATHQPHRLEDARYMMHEWVAWQTSPVPTQAPAIAQEFEAFNW